MRDANLMTFMKRNLWVIAVLSVSCITSGPVLSQSNEDILLSVLASDASVADKCNACRELQAVGTEKAIPALAELLTEPSVSHTARMALEVMPYPQASAALREAVSKTSGLTKSGIIASLGERRDAEAVTLFAESMKDDGPHVRVATAIALGKIGTTEAAELLAAGHAKSKVDNTTDISQALVICADRLFAAGNRAKALAIYTKLSQPNQPQAVRIGALRGRLQSANSGLAMAIEQAMVDDDLLVRQAAASQLPSLSIQAFRDFANKMQTNWSRLPAEGQVAMMAAIRTRQDKSLASIALQAASDKDLAVQVAAIRALGIVGDASALPLLIQSAIQDDEVGKAARHSLELISDPKLDQQIASILRAEDVAERRATWIEVVEARRPLGAVSLLLQEASGSHPRVRRRAMAALANLAGPNDIAAMTSAVLHAEKGSERDSAEKAVMLVCQQINESDRRADLIIQVLQSSSPKDQVALLPMLGRVGGSKAKQEIEAALRSRESARYDSAVRAICNWPDASVAEQLLALSENAESSAHRLSALRAFIRVIALPSDLPNTQKLNLLEQAMGRSVRDEERNLVLQRVSAVRTVEALRFLLPYLDQPSLAQTAGASITELGRHKDLRNPNQVEFIPALEKVLKTNQNQGTLENARRYIQAAHEG
ncbi:hypothetical protein CA13_01680 [Planctomycetes bacterium CA13]|uniref:HEAT repeat protein n=1 Tax=Novipirellula herctigrandis TaxID=2527986 RepID=A0A5C5YVC9_9BACT|nr:hypothetical protein CA13_01680 [Planctomycetes bacterium CA13]